MTEEEGAADRDPRALRHRSPASHANEVRHLGEILEDNGRAVVLATGAPMLARDKAITERGAALLEVSRLHDEPTCNIPVVAGSQERRRQGRGIAGTTTATQSSAATKRLSSSLASRGGTK